MPTGFIALPATLTDYRKSVFWNPTHERRAFRRFSPYYVCNTSHLAFPLIARLRTIFKERYFTKASKARKSANAFFGAENFVGTVPPQGGLSIYMAVVDPHLMSACNVSVDIDPALLTQLERIQRWFLLKLLGVAKTSPVAPLFSEAGMAKKSSWVSDIARVLVALHHPVHIDLFQPWSPVRIDAVLAAVEQSYLADIDVFLATSPKTPPPAT
ncbi:hypothetical protein IW261DRAFT_1684309 [Armillaria novae-zelandiae]|uniref:Uncharacterized protein n=1 Tax=Armillaria novae-zelandiae TaxID=153914 RepID=A0AA39U8Y1_9AGAR|nr:hypothetical protein IW261DRAFT_1684309 [Armillaria novae-zelandiae]